MAWYDDYGPRVRPKGYWSSRRGNKKLWSATPMNWEYTSPGFEISPQKYFKTPPYRPRMKARLLYRNYAAQDWLPHARRRFRSQNLRETTKLTRIFKQVRDNPQWFMRLNESANPFEKRKVMARPRYPSKRARLDGPDIPYKPLVPISNYKKRRLKFRDTKLHGKVYRYDEDEYASFEGIQSPYALTDIVDKRYSDAELQSMHPVAVMNGPSTLGVDPTAMIAGNEDNPVISDGPSIPDAPRSMVIERGSPVKDKNV